MRIILPSLALFILCFIFSGCKTDDDDPMIVIPPAEGTPSVVPVGTERYLNENSDYVFAQDQLRTYELIIPTAALNKLNEDPAAEEYVAASLVFEGDTISPVGVRYKGSIGAFAGCLSGPNLFTPSGAKTCTKLSMKVKINWEGREEKFFKLKKLQFHSMNNDPTQLRERLGYWLFKEMGVTAPRAVHARLMINGEYAGLFALIEQIDNRFIKYNFDDDDGNLYKEIWPLYMNGNPYSEQAYINALKTNEEDNPSVELIRNFGQQVAEADLSATQGIVEAYMNIDNILAYAVVDRTIKHDDGPFHWYCNNGSCTNHNYYWYEEPNKAKLHLIPWDLDNAFENIIENNNPVIPIADELGETSNDCSPFRHGAWGLYQWSASCDKLTNTWASYEDLYESKKHQLVNGPLSIGTADQLIDRWSDQIRSATQEATETHGDALSLSEWDAAIAYLKRQLEHARNN